MWHIFYKGRFVIVECGHFVEARVLNWELGLHIVAAAVQQTIPRKLRAHTVLGTSLGHVCVMCMLLGMQGPKPKFTKCFTKLQ